MANPGDCITCGGFSFYNNFDSANLAKVELVKVPETIEKGNPLHISGNCTFTCFQMDVKQKINHQAEAQLQRMPQTMSSICGQSMIVMEHSFKIITEHGFTLVLSLTLQELLLNSI
ncbi:hypothetical protein E2986_14165 [Frieseomelitta varia]|uniref:Uncharacterized protein n=1 Tax=Frieseomelitta varia TaxID=561572 RepID=A0A833RWW2_9HYME|nr:hypothetical protein E2986_14165 [Frieseomelitta varia]